LQNKINSEAIFTEGHDVPVTCKRDKFTLEHATKVQKWSSSTLF